MKRLLLVSLVAACGAPSRPASKPAVTPGASVFEQGGVPAPHYAGLFQLGAVWRYEVTTEESHWDDQDPAADADGTVRSSATSHATCSVAEVTSFAGGIASRVECDFGGQGQDPLSGIWAADATGLYRLSAWPDTGVPPERTAANRILPATPAETTEDLTDPAAPDATHARLVTRKGDGWCFTEQFAMADESWSGFCLGAGGVPTDGEFGWAGGSEHSTRFSLLGT